RGHRCADHPGHHADHQLRPARALLGQLRRRDPPLDPVAACLDGRRPRRHPGVRIRGGDRPVPAPRGGWCARPALLYPESGRTQPRHRAGARLSRRSARPGRGRVARPPGDAHRPTGRHGRESARLPKLVVRLKARSPAPPMDIDLVSRPIEAGDRLRTPPPPPEPAGSVLRHYRLDVRSVAIGMWVAELDRPWLDTPFLIRGFRVENEQELETLRRYCEYVEVDIEKSDFEVVDAIRRAEAARDEDPAEDAEAVATPIRGLRPAEEARVHQGPPRPRAREPRVSGGTRVRFRKLVHEAALAAEEPSGLRGLLRAFA